MTDTVWSPESYIAHNEAMRVADEKFQAERDRRYAEVATERALAMKIKETADLAALELARVAQTYKEQQSDTLRDKNLGASSIYATHLDLATVANKLETSITQVAERMEAALAPLASYVSSQRGSVRGTSKTVAYVVTAISIFFGLAGLILTIIKLG